jgi:ribulose-5-phosphate 4-epimerase/fuculose-1-phosphate aldolase
MDEASIRRELAAVYRICDKLGLNEGVCNHLSAILPGEPFRFLVIRYGLGWDEVTAENLVACDQHGNIVAGEGPVETTAIKIHAAVHLSDPQRYMCVLHTHMPFTTALCTGDRFELSMCHQNSLRFYKDIAYDHEYHGLVMDDNEGKRLAGKIQGKMVLLHRCHGPIVTGGSVAAAFDNLYYLERAAQVQVLAMGTLAAGGKLCTIAEEDARRTKVQIDDQLEEAAELHLRARMREMARADCAAGRGGWRMLTTVALVAAAAAAAGVAVGASLARR